MELLLNLTGFDIDKIETEYSNNATSATGKLTQSEIIEEFIYKKLILAVCVFGIAGNLLNFIVLSQKSLTYLMERMEKSAHYGLIALSVSDLFVCLTALPSVIYGTGKKTGGFAHASFDFRLMHKLYGNGVINTFILSSTWLTVTTALSRYIAICHPLQARQIIGKRFTITSLVAVFVVSILFNVPRFLLKEPRSVARGSNRSIYFAYPGPLLRNSDAKLAYLWIYFTLGIVVPLGVLVFCNAHLIKTLRMSLLARSDGQVSLHRAVRSAVPQRTTRERSEQAAYRITLTLIIIIVLFVFLFVPAELLNFFIEVAAQTRHKTEIFNIAITVGNLLQAINFAVNFILYSALNTYFRYTICRMVRCSRCRSDSFEVVGGHKLAAAVEEIESEKVRSNFRRPGRCVDRELLRGGLRQPVSTTWKSSQRTRIPTIAVSFV